MLNVDAPDSWDAAENHAGAKQWALIGQERAVRALEMGVSIRAKGYNIFVAGESGTGKHTAILDILSRHRKKNRNLRDIAYVQDFQEPDKPSHLIFPEGGARQFKEDLRLLVDRLGGRIANDLDAKNYKARRDALIAERESEENKILANFEGRLKAEGFQTVQTEDENQATDIAPVIDGEVIRFDDLQSRVSSGDVSDTVWTKTRERYFSNIDTMKRISGEIRVARDSLTQTLEILKTDTIRPGVADECALMIDKWNVESVQTYLRALEADVLKNADCFVGDGASGEEDVDLSVRYGVNIVVDRHGVEELPVIHEVNPSKTNLFGAIEAGSEVSGELRTNLMMIRAGSLLQADGGYLILHAEDVFSKERLWPELKRALQTGHVVPEVQSTPLGPLPILMKPEPIITETTVILIGSPRIYESLCMQDEEVMKLFKVVAEFSSVMNREAQTEREYAVFARDLARKEGLLPITPDGIQQIITYGIMLAERRDRLSTRFSLIGDLIRESHYSAEKSGKVNISGARVKEAIASRKYMGNLPEQLLIDQIREGDISIYTDGACVGVVNGLAVLERGYYSFGTPLQITVAIGPGKDGLINIERESGLSGELHDKGVYLLEGYLRHRFARRQPVSLTASIAVEQSYNEIDGDSASAAELAALLSAIAEIPLRQDVAVTGAVNQQGKIQPVGGIPEKIQGFFHTCEVLGFTGRQGVVVPAGNAKAVILSDSIVKAIREGLFHIWVADTISEVMALLTGMKAGAERRNGRFERNSVNENVRRGLVELAELSP